MEKEAKVFKYERPEFDGVKKSMLMCTTDLMTVHVQVVKSGGENNPPHARRRRCFLAHAQWSREVLRCGTRAALRDYENGWLRPVYDTLPSIYQC
jgi:hypothetical protein